MLGKQPKCGPPPLFFVLLLFSFLFIFTTLPTFHSPVIFHGFFCLFLLVFLCLFVFEGVGGRLFVCFLFPSRVVLFRSSQIEPQPVHSLYFSSAKWHAGVSWKVTLQTGMWYLSIQSNFDQEKQDKLYHTEHWTATESFQDQSLLKVSEHHTVQLDVCLASLCVHSSCSFCRKRLVCEVTLI